MSIFIILGSGASVDSGLMTYRGLNKDIDFIPEKFLTRKNFDKDPELFWKTMKPFYQRIEQAKHTNYLIQFPKIQL